jgi:hypothetical protein
MGVVALSGMGRAVGMFTSLFSLISRWWKKIPDLFDLELDPDGRQLPPELQMRNHFPFDPSQMM